MINSPMEYCDSGKNIQNEYVYHVNGILRVNETQKVIDQLLNSKLKMNLKEEALLMSAPFHVF